MKNDFIKALPYHHDPQDALFKVSFPFFTSVNLTHPHSTHSFLRVIFFRFSSVFSLNLNYDGLGVSKLQGTFSVSESLSFGALL